jgi:predicted enzyme related to lactoylglutathione lyase
MANRFCHMELTSADVAGAKAFYGAVFDWKIGEMPVGDGAYTFIDTGVRDTGGGMQAPMMEGQPNGWLVYAEVTNIEETLAKVEANGGRVVQPKTPVGPMGFIAVFLDPQGVGFGIWQSNAPPPAPKKTAKRAAPKKAAKPKKKK